LLDEHLPVSAQNQSIRRRGVSDAVCCVISAAMAHPQYRRR